ncbi:MAG: hypothetical protein LC732_02885, partial [Acidobacteria bacterium]|nr:hypothetical protein [Acidobacteriota bacterium]
MNGAPATIDHEAKTFLSQEIRLLEGANEIAATGADEVGNRLTIVLRLVLDTRAPEITIATPAPGACLDVDALAIAGTLFEPHLHSIAVKEGDASVAALVDPATRTWSAALPAGEGLHTFAVEAFDTVGHRAIASRSVSVDRTPPSLEIVTADGVPAGGLVSNRALSLFARVADLDRNPEIRIHLGSDPYASGTPISAEGAYTLTAVATDCAGHRTERSAAFTIDTTAPRFASFEPADGARVGAVPSSVTGAVDDDAVSIAVVGTGIVATPANGVFALDGLTFVEGENRFLLRATDRAGNVAETEYRLVVVTRPPSIEILESGAPLADGSLFNREINPEIRVSDPEARVTATLDGASFASGAPIGSDGAHTLAVTATDDLWHTASKQVSFTIDRTPPAIAITAPPPGRVSGESVAVEGT